MNKLRKNLIINISYQLVVVLIPLVLAPYVARTIGADGVGVYSYSFSLASFFALFGMLGVANYGNRTIAACGNDIGKRSTAFWNIWGLQICCSLIVLAIYASYILFFSTKDRIASEIQIIIVLCSAIDISWFFFGIEQFQITVLRNLIVKILNVILIFSLVKNKNDLYLYIFIMALGTFLNSALLFLFLRKYIVYVRPRISVMREHIKPMLVLFFPVIAINLYKIMDKVMIGGMVETVHSGYYEYAEKIIGLPGTIITAIGSVMLPRLSALVGERDNAKVKYLNDITMEVMMFLTIGMAGGIFCIARDFAPVFFGEEFKASGDIMMVLAPSVVFQGWANIIRTQYLIPNSQDKVYVQSAWLGAITNLGLNALLIPKYYGIGAAIGTFCAEAVVALFQSIKTKHSLPLGRYLKNTFIYFLPFTVMAMMIGFIKKIIVFEGLLLIMIEILAGAAAYLICSIPILTKRYKSIERRSIK